jgi:hypothetical protein
MRVGFAVARYPSNSYIDAAAAALEDAAQQHWIQLANERLQAAHNALGTTFLLLHLVRDKVLTLSTLNLETLQPETPPGSFWEVRGHSEQLRHGNSVFVAVYFLCFQRLCLAAAVCRDPSRAGCPTG